MRILNINNFDKDYKLRLFLNVLGIMKSIRSYSYASYNYHGTFISKFMHLSSTVFEKSTFHKKNFEFSKPNYSITLKIIYLHLYLVLNIS